MATFPFLEQQAPRLQPGGLLRNVVEQRTEPPEPAPEIEPGTALRERVEEPLEKELPTGVSQEFLESPQGPFLAQLEGLLRDGNFSPEQAATLINAIIEAPARVSRAGRAVARGPVGGPRAQGVTVGARLNVPRAAPARRVTTPRASVTGGRSVVGGGLPTRSTRAGEGFNLGSLAGLARGVASKSTALGLLGSILFGLSPTFGKLFFGAGGKSKTGRPS